MRKGYAFLNNLALAAIVLGGSSALAEEPLKTPEEHGVIAVIKAGKPIIDVRYRFEWVDNDAFARNAYANTVRTRLGYETGEFYNLKVLVEFENVASIGDDHFNSTTNGNAQFPAIADPDTTEINRAQVIFSGIDKTPVTIGRQAFNLFDQRFVGVVDFRQNQQTFDAARLSSTIIENLSVDYLYISRVHRILGDDHPLGDYDSDSHVFAATYDAKKYGKLSGYGLLLDFEEAPAGSSQTFGVRYENAHVFSKEDNVKAGVLLEYANQKDYAANPFDYSEDYLRGEAFFTASTITLRGGYEQLGGDGSIGFSTPLATLHKFQGNADVFLTTPANGIEDLYGTVQFDWANGLFGGAYSLFATYHDFKEEQGGASLGDELDAGLAASFGKHWSAEVKGAVYDGVATIADRNILWASLRFKY